MKVISLIPKTQKEGQKYILQATEKEIDKISGISNVEHIAGRIKVGHEITVSRVYDKLDYFKQNKKKLAQAVKTLRDTATTIKNLLPKET